jgi:hypothetical protein
MQKPNKKTERQRPFAGRCLSRESTVCRPEFPDRPAMILPHEWELYKKLTCELEGAECFVQDLRDRLQLLEQQLARRIEDQDESFERLVAALPVTKLLQ